MKIKIPVIFVIETEPDDENSSDNVSPDEIIHLKKVFISQMDYVVEDMDFIYDCVQERLPNGVSLASIRVEKE